MLKQFAQTPAELWLVASVSAFLIGMSKSGIKGMGMLAIPLMARFFGAKASTGLILPMLMAGDLFAVWYYHRHADSKSLRRFLPWALIGVVLGTILGEQLPEDKFKRAMGVIILFSVIALAWWDRRKRKAPIEQEASETKIGSRLASNSAEGLKQELAYPEYSKNFFKRYLFSPSLGLTAGFSTMVGNLAGPFANLYFMGLNMPKNMFIGTCAWFYLLLNWFKLPFHIAVWKTVDANSLPISLGVLPALGLGLWVGIRFVDRFPEATYRKFILFMTALGAILLWFK